MNTSTLGLQITNISKSNNKFNRVYTGLSYNSIHIPLCKDHNTGINVTFGSGFNNATLQGPKLA